MNHPWLLQSSRAHWTAYWTYWHTPFIFGLGNVAFRVPLLISSLLLVVVAAVVAGAVTLPYCFFLWSAAESCNPSARATFPSKARCFGSLLFSVSMIRLIYLCFFGGLFCWWYLLRSFAPLSSFVYISFFISLAFYLASGFHSPNRWQVCKICKIWINMM